MPRTVFRVALVASLILSGGCVPKPAPRPDPTPAPAPVPVGSHHPTAPEAAARLLKLHNDIRQARGLRPLEYDLTLQAAAFAQAEDCARRDVLTHQGSDGSWPWDRIRRLGYAYKSASENAAQQPQPRGWPTDIRTEDQAVDAWMQSPGHRANILGACTEMGGAYADSGRGTRYWIVVFATPDRED